MDPVEEIINHRNCRICGISSRINKFIVKGVKVCGRRCICCVSKINNERLRNKTDSEGNSNNYYSNYYQLNKEKMKETDRVRYQRNKERKQQLANQVVFDLSVERDNQRIINEPNMDLLVIDDNDEELNIINPKTYKVRLIAEVETDTENDIVV